MHDTLFIVLKTKHNLSIFEPEIKNPLSIFEPVGQNEYAYKKKNMYSLNQQFDVFIEQKQKYMYFESL